MGLAESTTKRLLKEMARQGILREQGKNKSRCYILNDEGGGEKI